MFELLRKTFSYRSLALASALLWGVLELIALQGARRARKR